jgi:hypothetical protein
MVPARAMLKKTLDADKVRSGLQFEVTLTKKVQLENGPELPTGTVLQGTVTSDDLNVEGRWKMALRFDQAVLKDGQMVPVKVTIVGYYRQTSLESGGYDINGSDATPVPNSWNDGTLAVDEIGGPNNADLHSRIASKNSGVFVSTKKDFKLTAGSEITLAIAAKTTRQQSKAEAAETPIP